MEFISLVYIVILGVCLITLLIVAFHAQRFWYLKSGSQFLGIVISVFVYVLSIFMLSLSSTPEQAFFWARLRILGATGIPAFTLLFTMSFVDKPASRWLVRLLPVYTFLLLLLTWTDGVFPMIFRDWTVVKTGYLLVEQSRFGEILGSFVIYFNALMIASLIMLGVYIKTAQGKTRRQSQWIFAAFLLVTAVTTFQVMIGNTLLLNVTVIAYAIMALILAFSVFHLRLFTVLPMAYNNIFLHLRDAVLVLNAYDEIIQANHAARKLFGSHLSGKPIHDILSYEEKTEFELVWKESIFDAHLSRLITANGSVAGKILSLHDITLRKKMEDALRAGNERYDRLVERIPMMVYRLHRTPQGDYIFDYVSPRVRQLNRLEPDDVMLHPELMFNQIHPDEIDNLRERQEESARELNNFVWEGRVLVEGEERWFRLESQPEKLEDGTVVWDGIQIDITMRKQAELERAQALEKEKELSEIKTRFISMASHEFKTPLATIMSSVDMMRNYGDRLNHQQIHQRLERIREQVIYLTTIMNDVLRLTQMQARHAEYHPEPVNLDAFCHNVLDEFQYREDITHRLVYTSSSPELMLSVDRKLFRQILNNLITNAFKYSAPTTVVRVTVDSSDEQVCILVADEGIGIPDSDLASLFDPFRRASNVGNRSGTGLGLAITKEAVELHGGAISVTSKVGIGTTFTVTIPLKG